MSASNSFFFAIVIWGTNLPLGKLELGQSAAFGSEARAILQGPANGTSSNGEVAVVAMNRSAKLRRIRDAYRVGNIRQTGSFPGGRHFEEWVGWRLEVLEDQKAFSDLRCGWELSEVLPRHGRRSRGWKSRDFMQDVDIEDRFVLILHVEMVFFI